MISEILLKFNLSLQGKELLLRKEKKLVMTVLCFLNSVVKSYLSKPSPIYFITWMCKTYS